MGRVIGYYAHHQGSGHLTRLRSLAAHVGEPLCGVSSLPPPPGWTGPWLALPRDDSPAPTTVRDTRDVTAGGVLHWAPPHHRGLAERMALVAAWAARHRPRVLVVDVSVEIALLARLCGVPTVVVALPGERLDRAHRLAYDSAEALLAPWPAEAHTDGWPDSWRSKAWYVGGMSRFDGRTPAPRPARAGSRRRVLLLWGAGGRAPDGAAVAAARAATPGWEWVERDPVTSPSPDVWSDLAEADVVVTHAGQNAVAEVAAARRPAVVVAQPRPFGEQAATAAAVERLGAAVGLARWPEAAAWPGLLDRALAAGGDRWARWSTGAAAACAAQLLERQNLERRNLGGTSSGAGEDPGPSRAPGRPDPESPSRAVVTGGSG